MTIVALWLDAHFWLTHCVILAHSGCCTVSLCGGLVLTTSYTCVFGIKHATQVISNIVNVILTGKIYIAFYTSNCSNKKLTDITRLILEHVLAKVETDKDLPMSLRLLFYYNVMLNFN